MAEGTRVSTGVVARGFGAGAKILVGLKGALACLVRLDHHRIPHDDLQPSSVWLGATAVRQKPVEFREREGHLNQTGNLSVCLSSPVAGAPGFDPNVRLIRY